MTLATSSRLTLAVVLVALATACSVADYKKPVGDFAEATRNAEEALVALDAQVTDAYAAVLRDRAIAGEEFVKFDSGNCLVASPRCQLVVIGDDDTAESLSPDPALRRMIILMRAVRVYSDGLAAIVDADTVAKVTAHVNATLGSIESLAGTVATLRPAERAAEGAAVRDVSEFTTPVGQAVNWLVGQYVAKVKLDGLERATSHAQPVIAETAGLFGDAAELASDVPKKALSDEVLKRLDTFRVQKSEDSLNRLIESAAAYDLLLVANPPAVFERLKDAHDALANKLQDDDLSLANAMAKIEVFATEAKTLAKILKDLAALSDK